MKKLTKIFSTLALALTALAFTSCADAIVNDGSEVRSYVNSGSGSGGSGNWCLCKNSAYEIFDIQVWADGAGTFTYLNSGDYGRFSITDVGGGWIGGGLVSSESGKNFDFSSVKTMTFKIRGSIDPLSLYIGVQGSGKDELYPSKASLKSVASVNSLSESDWTEVSIDVSEAASGSIINAFCIIGAGDWGKAISAGNWFDIKDLDYLDSSGSSVILTLK